MTDLFEIEKFLRNNGIVGAVLVQDHNTTNDKFDAPMYMFMNNYLIGLRMLEFFRFQTMKYDEKMQSDAVQQTQPNNPTEKPNYIG